MKDFWVYEEFPLEKPVAKTGLLVKKRLFSRQSPYQKIEVVDTYEYGRVLILDGIFQTSEKDEFIYHEMMAHLPFFYHSSPQKILIIGGGDGGVLREVLKHPVRKVYLVEIDKMVIEAVKKFLPFVCQKAFQDKRAELVIGDGAKFIKQYKDFFDVIIIDSSDSYGPSKILFSKKFYQDVFQALNTSGLIMAQTGSIFYQIKEMVGVYSTLKRIFPFVKIHLVNIPLYDEWSMSFQVASKKINLETISLNQIKKRFAQLNLRTKYYSPVIHQSSSYLPNFLKDDLGFNSSFQKEKEK